MIVQLNKIKKNTATAYIANLFSYIHGDCIIYNVTTLSSQSKVAINNI